MGIDWYDRSNPQPPAPGPWYWREEWRDLNSPDPREATQCAALYAADGSRILGGGPAGDVRSRNAGLIAAAPEMEASLRRLIAAIVDRDNYESEEAATEALALLDRIYPDTHGARMRRGET